MNFSFLAAKLRTFRRASNCATAILFRLRFVAAKCADYAEFAPTKQTDRHCADRGDVGHASLPGSALDVALQ